MEKINEFSYRGKKYRTKYLDELSKLYKDAEHGKNGKKEKETTRERRTD